MYAESTNDRNYYKWLKVKLIAIFKSKNFFLLIVFLDLFSFINSHLCICLPFIDTTVLAVRLVFQLLWGEVVVLVKFAIVKKISPLVGTKRIIRFSQN